MTNKKKRRQLLTGEDGIVKIKIQYLFVGNVSKYTSKNLYWHSTIKLLDEWFPTINNLIPDIGIRNPLNILTILVQSMEDL